MRKKSNQKHKVEQSKLKWCSEIVYKVNRYDANKWNSVDFGEKHKVNKIVKFNKQIWCAAAASKFWNWALVPELFFTFRRLALIDSALIRTIGGISLEYECFAKKLHSWPMSHSRVDLFSFNKPVVYKQKSIFICTTMKL